MKRILFGLGCTLVLPCSLLAQDRAPAARLGIPAATIRAQSPGVEPAGVFDIPKAMPKGTVSELPSAPSPLPLPGSPPMPVGPSGPLPSGSLPPGTIVGPMLSVPPGPIYGAPIPSGPVNMDPYVGVPSLMGASPTQSNWYAGVEALAWLVNGYKAPPLVSSGPFGTSGILGNGKVAILYGGDTIETNPRYGARITLGYWFSPCWAVEMNAFYTRSVEETFTASTASVGGADLARPFFSTNQQGEASEIISRNNIVNGSVTVLSRSHLFGGELNARRHWWTDPVNSLDLIAGFRYLSMQEELEISESSVGLPAAGPASGLSRSLTDSFKTRNNFYGIQIGAIYQYASGPWNVELRAKIAGGVNRQYVSVDGEVTAISGGNPPDMPGGLLALRSNIGEQRRDKFAFVPEVGINVGYDINSRLRVYGGYTLMYWSMVARPGEQVDRFIDENLLPDWPARPPANGLRPLPKFETSNVWVQGVNFGLQYKW